MNCAGWIIKAGMGATLLGLMAAACATHQHPVLLKGTEQAPQRQATSLPTTEFDTATKLKVQTVYGKLPLHFEANQGQSAEQVKFLSRGHGYTLFLTPTEAVLALRKNGGSAETGKRGNEIPQPPAPSTQPPAVVRLQLVDANATPQVMGLEQLPGKAHYFIGNDRQNWRTNIPTYRKVQYREVYPGVDLVYYGNQRQLEHDFVIAPGVDPGVIKLTVRDQAGQALPLEIDPNGDLVVHVASSEVRLRKPVAYQEENGVKHEVAGSYVLWSSEPPVPSVSFQVVAYDATRPLIIDPVLVYSTYLGGSDSDEGHGIAVDASGNAYVTGLTGSIYFPTTEGAFDTTCGTDNTCNNNDVPVSDAFVARLDAAGSALVYSTYLGGSGFDEGHGIAVDASGNAYVTGLTKSTDFPTANALQPASGGSNDAFVAKVAPDGSSLVYSTYLGGGGNESGKDIALDAADNAYVTGSTNSTDFPLGSLFGSGGGGNDAFVVKVSPTGTALVYVARFGGTVDAEGEGIAVDAFGSAYVTGNIGAPDTSFPVVNGFQSSPGSGGPDAFVTKVSPDGSSLVYSSYLGGNDFDLGFDIAVDALGNAYVTGYTASTDFPAVNALQPTPGTPGTGTAFVTKVAPNGSALVYSTYLGGSGGEAGDGIAVDAFGSAYVSGATASADFPITGNAPQPTSGSSPDAFVTKLAPSGKVLTYSTYLGGGGVDNGFGIAVDAAGSAYVTGPTTSTDFPTSLDPAQAINGGNQDAFVAKLSPVPLAPPVLNPIGDKTINESASLSFSVSATSSSGNELALLIDRLPTWTSFSGFVPVTADNTVWEGVVSGTPDSAQAGRYSIVFEVCDTDTRQCDSEHIILTVNDTVADTDRDGVPNTTDNSPDEFNPSQSDVDRDGVGDVTDNCPTPNASQADSNGNGVGDVCEGQVTATVLSISPPTSPLGYMSGESVKVTVEVTFEPIPVLGDYYVVRPTPYNVELRLTDSTGQVVRPDQIAEGPPLSLPLDLARISTVRQTFSTEIELTDWYTRLPPSNYAIHATYLSFVKDPNVDAAGNCTADSQEQGACYAPLWMGRAPAGETLLTVVGGSGGGGPVDQCPTLSGNAGGTGCPVADKNVVRLHTVESGGGSSQAPLVGVEVRVFDRNSSAFQALAGAKNPPGALYPALFEANVGRVGACVTDSSGVCFVGEAVVGDYLVIVKFVDVATKKMVYTGKQKEPKDFVNGVAVKDFQIIKLFKKGVFQGYGGDGSNTVVVDL